MKVILELEEVPENCLECPLNNYIMTDFGEELYCAPLSSKYEKNMEGKFLNRREDCPLKGVDDSGG